MPRCPLLQQYLPSGLRSFFERFYSSTCYRGSCCDPGERHLDLFFYSPVRCRGHYPTTFATGHVDSSFFWPCFLLPAKDSRYTGHLSFESICRAIFTLCRQLRSLLPGLPRTMSIRNTQETGCRLLRWSGKSHPQFWWLRDFI